MLTLAGFALIGLGANIWLWHDDIHNRGGILNEVKKKQEISSLMTSPPPERRSLPPQEGIDIY